MGKQDDENVSKQNREISRNTTKKYNKGDSEFKSI